MDDLTKNIIDHSIYNFTHRDREQASVQNVDQVRVARPSKKISE